MVVFFLVGSPKRPVQREFQLLSSASPIVVQHVGKAVIIGQFTQLFKLFFQIISESVFCSGYDGVFALFSLKSDYDCL